MELTERQRQMPMRQTCTGAEDDVPVLVEPLGVEVVPDDGVEDADEPLPEAVLPLPLLAVAPEPVPEPVPEPLPDEEVLAVVETVAVVPPTRALPVAVTVAEGSESGMEVGEVAE